MSDSGTRIPEILEAHADEIRAAWIDAQLTAETRRSDLLPESALKRDSRRFYELLLDAVREGSLDEIGGPSWEPLRDFLAEMTMARARRGFDPSETATFLLLLKQPVFEKLEQTYADEPSTLVDESWRTSVLLDKIGLFATERYIESREAIIARQREEMLELSTPVVEVWDGIVAMPLIGTLDSRRAQQVTEALLDEIVKRNAEIAILDITGVPTVDTLTAQHLLKSVSAARLMGADCVISGVRPQIALTMVHLGVTLGDVITKSTLASALKFAFERRGVVVSSSRGG